ncbi:MAG: hypothetical protein SPJ34_04445 [Candidatus Ornithospirochaeta sp.]|nr:hypothetical protein [Candidatus Ornithospirochaeta sp.]
MKKAPILLMLVLLAFSCSEASSLLKVSYHGEDGSVFSQEDALKGAKASDRAWDQECACTDHGVFLFWSEDRQSAFDFSKPLEKSVGLYPVFDEEKHSVSLIDAEASGFGELSQPRNFTQILIDLDNNMGISPQYGKAKPQ